MGTLDLVVGHSSKGWIRLLRRPDLSTNGRVSPKPGTIGGCRSNYLSNSPTKRPSALQIAPRTGSGSRPGSVTIGSSISMSPAACPHSASDSGQIQKPPLWPINVQSPQIARRQYSPEYSTVCIPTYAFVQQAAVVTTSNRPVITNVAISSTPSPSIALFAENASV